MTEDRQDGRAFLLMVLLAVWLATYAFSVSLLLVDGGAGAGPAVGGGRIFAFLGWQGIAGLIAFASFAVGRGFPKGSGVRRISGVPLGMALAVVGLVVVSVLLR